MMVQVLPTVPAVKGHNNSEVPFQFMLSHFTEGTSTEYDPLDQQGDITF